jgi:feruloyl esterase
MLVYAPPMLPRRAPLVVVLHGCAQTALAYDEGSGWSALAQKYGFAVLYAEQKRANNLNLCFNWFRPGDTGRDRGEALSIRQMVMRMGSDPTRTFITGLSAGGAMASVMLATYPEVFSGGGIIAGLPYGAASDTRGAMAAMKRAPSRTAKQWGDLVRSAAPHAGARPTVSIWHGTHDQTVGVSNAAASLKQWTDVHGVAEGAFTERTVAGHQRKTWSNSRGKAVVELLMIERMGHGTPVRRTKAQAAAGSAGPFILDVGVSSSLNLVKSWGLDKKHASTV